MLRTGGSVKLDQLFSLIALRDRKTFFLLTVFLNKVILFSVFSSLKSVLLFRDRQAESIGYERSIPFFSSVSLEIEVAVRL